MQALDHYCTVSVEQESRRAESVSVRLTSSCFGPRVTTVRAEVEMSLIGISAIELSSGFSPGGGAVPTGGGGGACVGRVRV